MTIKTTLRILGLMLVYLKLTSSINFSWVVVLLPFLVDLIFGSLLPLTLTLLTKIVTNKNKGY